MLTLQTSYREKSDELPCQLRMRGSYRQSQKQQPTHRIWMNCGQGRESWAGQVGEQGGERGFRWSMLFLPLNPVQTGLIDLIRAINPLACLRSPRPAAVIPVTPVGIHMPSVQLLRVLHSSLLHAEIVWEWHTFAHLHYLQSRVTHSRLTFEWGGRMGRCLRLFMISAWWARGKDPCCVVHSVFNTPTCDSCITESVWNIFEWMNKSDSHLYTFPFHIMCSSLLHSLCSALVSSVIFRSQSCKLLCDPKVVFQME